MSSINILIIIAIVLISLGILCLIINTIFNLNKLILIKIKMLEKEIKSQEKIIINNTNETII